MMLLGPSLYHVEYTSYTTFGTLGRGGGEVDMKIYFFLFLIYMYLRSIFVFIKQYCDSMGYSSIFAENYELYLKLIYVE